MAREDGLAREDMLAAGGELVEFQDKEALRAAVPDMLAVWAAKMAESGHGEEAKKVVEALRPLTQ